MATLNWADIVEVSHDEAKQEILGWLDVLGFTVTSWQEGSIPLYCTEVGAALYSRLSLLAVFLKEMAFNATSIGDALTNFSYSHYKNTRAGSIAAQRAITLTCSATEGPHTINLGDVVSSDAAGSATFRNVDGLSVVYPYSLGSGTSKTFLFEAEVSGTGGNLANNTVTTLVTTLAGVTITLDTLNRSGVDAESDTRLRLRNETRWDAQSEFEKTADACKNIALNASAAIISVGVDDENPRGAGTFDVYLAGLDATAGGSDITAAQAAFDLRVMGSSSTPATCLCLASPEASLSITGTVYFNPNFTAAEVEAAVESSLVALVRSVPIGGFDYSPGPSAKVPINDIENAIKSTTINGVAVIKTVVLSVPAADFAVTSFGKVTRGTWTLTYSPTST